MGCCSIQRRLDCSKLDRHLIMGSPRSYMQAPEARRGVWSLQEPCVRVATKTLSGLCQKIKTREQNYAELCEKIIYRKMVCNLQTIFL